MNEVNVGKLPISKLYLQFFSKLLQRGKNMPPHLTHDNSKCEEGQGDY